MLSQPATRSGAWVPPRLRSNWDTMGWGPKAEPLPPILAFPLPAGTHKSRRPMIISFRIAAAALARPEHHLLDSALRFAAERGVVRKELDDGMLAVETTFAAWAELGSLADTLADPDEHADAEDLVDALELQVGEDAPAPAIAIKLSGLAAQPKSELQVFVGGGRMSFTSLRRPPAAHPRASAGGPIPQAPKELG